MTSPPAVVIFLAAAFGALSPRMAAAQSYSPRIPHPGRTLRWVTVDGQTGRGEMLEAFNPSSGRLALRLGHRFCTRFDRCPPDALELDELRQLEVRVAAGTGRGAAIGGIAGFLFGASIGAGLAELDGCGTRCILPGILLTGVSTGVFAILGGIIGGQFETWRPVRLSG